MHLNVVESTYSDITSDAFLMRFLSKLLHTNVYHTINTNKSVPRHWQDSQWTLPAQCRGLDSAKCGKLSSSIVLEEQAVLGESPSRVCSAASHTMKASRGVWCKEDGGSISERMSEMHNINLNEWCLGLNTLVSLVWVSDPTHQSLFTLLCPHFFCTCPLVSGGTSHGFLCWDCSRILSRSTLSTAGELVCPAERLVGRMLMEGLHSCDFACILIAKWAGSSTS